ncbi:MAG: superoxide dismutase [Streptosporangiales bacterium]|nr:superoxide dismutase [Streptosporangiales bacterium]
MTIRSLITAGLAVGLGIGLTAPAAAETRAAHDTRSYTIPGDRVFPEGVAFDRGTGHFYVGSTTDGTIFRGHLRRPALEVFLPGGVDGRTTAIGMKVDRKGRLYVAGGATGQMWVYDLRTRMLVRRFDTGLREGTFVNDLALDRWGNAYFTDSMHPVLWRVPAGAIREGDSPGSPEAFLDFTGTPAEYGPGFNLNGIAPTGDGRQLLAVASNTGKLFRIDLMDNSVAEVPVAGGPLLAGDGLQVLGGLLFVVRNQFELVTTVRLRGGATRGRVVSEYTDPAFGYPTTAALAGARLLVVNSQFDRRETGDPELPFTVASVPVSRLLH